MSLRRRIDSALAVIGFDASYGGLGRFRSGVFSLSGEVRLAVRLGARGRQVVARAGAGDGATRIDRFGQVTTTASCAASEAPAMRAAVSAMSATLGNPPLRWRRERVAPALECVIATATVPMERGALEQRLGAFLALRLAGPAARANALIAARSLAEVAGELEVSLVLAAGELLPEVFVRARWPDGSPPVTSQSWFPPPIEVVGRALADNPPMFVELALSPELGLGLGLELPDDALTEPLPGAAPPISVGRTQLAILAASAGELPATLQSEFQNAILSNDIAPLPGPVPSASRAHARALARRFATTRTLPTRPVGPSRVQRIAARSLAVGIERAVGVGAAG